MPKRTFLVVAVVVLVALNVAQLVLHEKRSAAAGRISPLLGLSQDQQEVVDDFHALFYSIPDVTWDGSKWLGIECQQNPNDVWVTQEIINEIKPDLIVETGTYKGGSAVLWSSLLELIKPDAQIVTIDIEDHSAAARQHPLFQRRVTFIKGSSTAPEVVERVREMARGRKTLVILDSDHKAAHVLAELRAYKDLVSPGSYMIVQDTNVNGHPVFAEHGPGPMEAVDQFLREMSGFTADRSRERLLFTMHPRGYLRRDESTPPQVGMDSGFRFPVTVPANG